MSNIDALAHDWLVAKRAEQEAAQRRLEIEKELAAALDAKAEGSITHNLENHKVTLNQPVRRTVDGAAWEKVSMSIPSELHPVRWKAEPDVKGIKWLQENEPKMWSQIASAFTTKPGKINIKVEKM